MLVALLRANPAAFSGGNMNRLLAGKDVVVPATDAAASIEQGDAHREVSAQSADFAAYRSRLAQIATAAPPVPEKAAIAAGQGRVTPKVEDKSATQKAGDQLKIAKAEASASVAAAAAAKKDEEVARQRALKEEKERAAALKKSNDDLKRAMDLEAKAAAAKKKADDERAAKDKAAADKMAAAQAAAEKVAAAKAAADKAAADKLAAVKAAADKLAADKAAAAAAKAAAEAKAETTAEAPKVAVPAPAPAPAPAAAPAPAPAPAAGTSWTDTLLSPVALGGAIGVLLLALVGVNIARRGRAGKADFRADGDPMAANSLFGAAGGQSVDTGATSTFNSSFIPAASQLDSNEVDPVAEADVYVAYGREEQAEDILKEALRLQPDRHAVRVKLLEIYSRRGDTASFNAVATELHSRTGGVGDDWERAAKLGKGLDPNNPLYAGAPSGPDSAARTGPTTNLRLDSGGETAAPPATEVPTGGSLELDTISHLVGDPSKLDAAGAPLPETALAPETLMPVDAQSGKDAEAVQAIRSRFEASLPPETPAAPAAPVPPAAPTTRAGTPTAIDFGALDFDLGPSKLSLDAPTELPAEIDGGGSANSTMNVVEPPTIPSLDLMFPPTQPGPRPVPPPPTVSGSVPIPKIDLNLPAASAPRTEAPMGGSLEEALSRPTLVGAVGGLNESDMPRLGANTDQATVPLIDFDLTGADAALTGRRTETQAGSPMASQMATKLDLARGYIDLGVKDGARELLEEVMKDGTREQRQQAVELIKLVEA